MEEMNSKIELIMKIFYIHNIKKSKHSSVDIYADKRKQAVCEETYKTNIIVMSPMEIRFIPVISLRFLFRTHCPLWKDEQQPTILTNGLPVASKDISNPFLLKEVITICIFNNYYYYMVNARVGIISHLLPENS